jgi:hypothetical protein
VNNEEGGADGPGEVEFTVAAGCFVGSEAVGTGFTEFVDIGGHAGPKEALANAVESFVTAEVGGSGAGVEGVEEEVAEWGRDDNECNGVAIGVKGLMDAEVWVVEGEGISG